MIRKDNGPDVGTNEGREIIAEEFEKIRREMAAYHKEHISLRYGDLYNVVRDRMKNTYLAHTSDVVAGNLQTVSAESVCPHRAACLKHVEETTQKALDDFDRGNADIACAALLALRETVEDACAPCRDRNCAAHIRFILTYAQDMIGLFDRISEKNSGERGDVSAPAGKTKRFSASEAEKAENLIVPLAHAKRLMIMEQLSVSEKSFSEISGKTGMKTGHLQFHLRALKKGGYAESGPKTRNYALTEKGRAALLAIRQFAAQMDVFDDGKKGDENRGDGN